MHQWYYFHAFWLLHGIFFSFPCIGERKRRFLTRGLQTRNLLYPCYPHSSLHLGIKWNFIRTANRWCPFFSHQPVYGAFSPQTVKIVWSSKQLIYDTKSGTSLFSTAFSLHYTTQFISYTTKRFPYITVRRPIFIYESGLLKYVDTFAPSAVFSISKYPLWSLQSTLQI